MRGISELAKETLASPEELCVMELSPCQISKLPASTVQQAYKPEFIKRAHENAFLFFLHCKRDTKTQKLH
jgi:hypothetical protein